VIALRNAVEHLGRGAQGEFDLNDALKEAARDLEPGASEDAKHRCVLWEHLGDKTLDPFDARVGREPLEQSAPDPSPLEIVSDHECDFGA
jgi:hypothetical protein